MSGPEDIPADVWTAAETAFDLMLCNCIEASGNPEQFRIDSIEPHARAILAERERCAKIADDAAVNCDRAFRGITALNAAAFMLGRMSGVVIAIRKGGE